MTKSLRATIILCLLINLSLCSSSFLDKRQLQEIDESKANENVNNNDLTDVSSRDLESDENQFQLLTFNSILIHNKFNAKWTSDDSKDDSYTVLSECSSGNAKDSSSALPSCLLTSYNVCKDSNKMTQLSIDLNQSKDHAIDATNSVLKFNGVSTQILKKENDKVISEKKCNIDVSYSFINTPTQKPFVYASDNINDLSIQVKVLGGDCEADNTTPLLQVEFKKYDLVKVYGYIAIMILLGLIQTIACGVLIIQIDKNNVFAKQTCLGTLCMLIAFDFSIYLQHSAYWTSVSSLMIGVVVLFFVVSVFFEPALLYFVFSVLQRRHNVSIRTLIFKLYFWLLFSVLGIVATQTYQKEYVYYTYPLFLVPQILDSMIHRQKYKWNYTLLLGLGFPKFIYLAILSFNPFDIFTEKLDPSVMVMAFTIFAFELVILKIQTRWPGLGIVKKSAKNVFNYECQNDEVETVAEVVCSICTEKIGLEPIIGQQPTQDQEAGQEVAKAQPIMKTPCQHYYHESCLKEWFKKKYECPNCRKPVPPLEDDDDE